MIIDDRISQRENAIFLIQIDKLYLIFPAQFKIT